MSGRASIDDGNRSGTGIDQVAFTFLRRGPRCSTLPYWSWSFLTKEQKFVEEATLYSNMSITYGPTGPKVSTRIQNTALPFTISPIRGCILFRKELYCYYLPFAFYRRSLTEKLSNRAHHARRAKLPSRVSSN